MRSLLLELAFLPLFFLYPFTAFQLVYGEINIPFADIVAMGLGLVFVFAVFARIAVKKTFPRVLATGYVFYSLFLLVALISLRNSPGYSESLHYFFRKPFFYFVVYFLSVGTLLTWLIGKKLSTFYDFIACSSVLIALIAIGAFLYRLATNNVFGAVGIPYLTNNDKTLSLSLIVNLPFMLAYVKTASGHRRLLFRGAIYLSLVAVFLSFSKTSWVMALIVFTLFKYGDLKKYPLTKIAFLFLMLASAAATGVLIYYMVTHNAKITNAEMSRTLLAVGATKIFLDHPFVGSGIGSFMLHMQDWKDLLPVELRSATELDAHGLVFKLLSETGLAGFILFSAFYMTVSLSVYRRSRTASDPVYRRLLFGCFVAVVVNYGSNFFLGTDTYSPRLWFPLAFSAAHVFITEKERDDTRR